MPIVKDIKIVKIPLPESEKKDYPKNFPKMPIMYLELLENKGKIKQDLINKDYIPVPKNQEEKKEIDRQASKKMSKEEDTNKDDSMRLDEVKENLEEETQSVQKSKKSDSISISSKNSSKSSASSSSSSKSSRSDDSSISVKSDDTTTTKKSRSSGLSQRLKELLGSDLKKDSVHSKFTPYEKYQAPHINHPQAHNQAPTLEQLKAKGEYQPEPVLRDINRITTSEHQDEDKKRELIFKFDILRKSYANSSVHIPEYTIHSDYNEMQKSYDDTLKRLSLDSNVENYKTYLICGFFAVEYILGNFLNFDMSGFSQQQMVQMKSYEKLLIELGEKSYVPTGSKYPVELLLLFLIIMNAGIFIMGKMIFKKTGANLINAMNSNTQPPQGQPMKPKRRMRGPDIDVSQIPDLDDKKGNVIESQ